MIYTTLVKCPSCNHEGYAIVNDGTAVSETTCDNCNVPLVMHDCDGETEWQRR